MAFVKKQGKSKQMFLPVTTSTVLTKGALLTYTSGLLVAAAAGTAAADIVGVSVKTILSTDSDYATARLIPVEVPVERFCVWEADVTSGLVSTDVGVEVDLTDSLNVNRGASAIKVARAVKVITATKGWFLIKFMGAY